jgi:hypothetical protein
VAKVLAASAVEVDLLDEGALELSDDLAHPHNADKP